MRMKIRILPTGARSVVSINKSRQCDIAFLKEAILYTILTLTLTLTRGLILDNSYFYTI